MSGDVAQILEDKYKKHFVETMGFSQFCFDISTMRLSSYMMILQTVAASETRGNLPALAASASASVASSAQ